VSITGIPLLITLLLVNQSSKMWLDGVAEMYIIIYHTVHSAH